MISIGKYKLLGILFSLASSCYGSYEIYNRFVPGKSSSPSVKQSERMEEKNINIEKQPNTPIEEPEQQLKVEPIEPEKKEGQEDPQEIEGSKEESPPPEITIPNPKLENTKTKMVYVSSERYNFINADGSISIRPGTVGSQFKNYLITSTKDEGIGSKKLNLWESDIKYHKERQKNEPYHPSKIQIGFTLKSGQTLENRELQKRCHNAYSKSQNKGIDSISTRTIKRPYDKISLAYTYWQNVGRYCGQPGQDMPEGGYGR